MRHAIPLLALSILFLALLSACGTDNKNPVAPGKTSFTISGRTMSPSGKEYQGFAIHLNGPGGEMSVMSDSLGNFSFPELTPGVYTLTAGKDAWIVEPDTLTVTVGKADVKTDEFICLKSAAAKKTAYICGRVRASGGENISGLSINFSGKETTVASHNITVGEDGYFYCSVEPGKNYVLHPSMQDFEYTITPDSMEVTADRAIIIRNFTARRSTAPLHRISGHILDRGGNPLTPIGFSVSAYVFLMGNTVNVTTYADSTGAFSLQAKDGVYTVRMLSNLYAFTPPDIPVTVDGKDTVLPDVLGIYNGPTYYLLSGKVVDRNGKGISDAWVDAGIPWGSFQTDANGAFQRNMPIRGSSDNDRITIVFIPRKSGVTFNPDSTIVTFVWKPEVMTGEPVTLPDFIGTDIIASSGQ